MSGWLSSGATYTRIDYQKIPHIQWRIRAFGTPEKWKCTETITVDEARGLTKTYAESEAAAAASDTVTAKSSRDNDADGYKCVKTERTFTDWEIVT
jgi:hypothetical protein